MILIMIGGFHFEFGILIFSLLLKLMQISLTLIKGLHNKIPEFNLHDSKILISVFANGQKLQLKIFEMQIKDNKILQFFEKYDFIFCRLLIKSWNHDQITTRRVRSAHIN